MDNLDILKFLLEEALLPRTVKNNEKLKFDINLNKLIVTHDASNCFNYLFPDLSIDDDELNDLYSLAKNKNSEAILKLFEQDEISMDFDFDMFQENEALAINL